MDYSFISEVIRQLGTGYYDAIIYGFCRSNKKMSRHYVTWHLWQEGKYVGSIVTAH